MAILLNSCEFLDRSGTAQILCRSAILSSSRTSPDPLQIRYLEQFIGDHPRNEFVSPERLASVS